MFKGFPNVISQGLFRIFRLPRHLSPPPPPPKKRKKPYHPDNMTELFSESDVK